MITIYSNNTVALDGRRVGRIHKQDAQPMRAPRPVRFYTASGDPVVTGYDLEHSVDAPLYVGGPADWTISPEFERAVRAICGAAGA